MKHLCLVTVVLLALTVLVLPDASSVTGASVTCGTWSAADDLDTARSVFGNGGVAGGRIHVFDGLASGGGTALHDHEAFNGTIWSPDWAPSDPLALMLTQRNQFVTGTVNGKIYAISGDKSSGCCNLTTVNEEYDPSTNNWTSRAPIPTPREIFAATVLDDEIYAIGGATPLEDAVEVYTPATNSWRDVASLNKARGGHAAATANGKVYAISGGTGTCDASVEAYTPGNPGSWSFVADMPECRTVPMAAEFNGKIYVFGGSGPGPSGVATKDVFRYDPIADSWTQCSEQMPKATQAGAAVVFQNKIFIVAGATAHGAAPALADVQVFTPSPNGVGGVVELHAGTDAPAEASASSSARDYTVPVAAAAMASAVVALGAGGWYARRRWLG